jgi:hypothetical protein
MRRTFAAGVMALGVAANPLAAPAHAQESRSAFW